MQNQEQTWGVSSLPMSTRSLPISIPGGSMFLIWLEDITIDSKNVDCIYNIDHEP